MGRFSFDDTIKQFDLIVSDMNESNVKNDVMFRRTCREIFQKSYSKFDLDNSLSTVTTLLVGKVISACQKSKESNNNVLHAKLFRKLNSSSVTTSYSDLGKINQFLKTSKFTLVVKLLKIQYDHGFRKAVFSINLD